MLLNGEMVPDGKMLQNEGMLPNEGTASEKTLYLTFDDGPSARYTPQLLSLLEEQEIQASFFVVGKFAAKNPKILSRMAAAGHLIGLHSYDHQSAYLMTAATARKDFQQSIAILTDLGIRPRFFRPPWGHTRNFTLELAAEFDLLPVYWDVMAEDWRAFQQSDEIARRLLARAFPGAVICLHDGRGRNRAPARTIQALKQAIPAWRAEGYRFKTITADLCPQPPAGRP